MTYYSYSYRRNRVKLSGVGLKDNKPMRVRLHSSKRTKPVDIFINCRSMYIIMFNDLIKYSSSENQCYYRNQNMLSLHSKMIRAIK